MDARVITAGDNVVDRYLDRGVMYPGGNAVNVAVHLRRLGVDAAYLGVVGTDAAGRVVRRALQSERVDTTHLRSDPGANAYATVEVIAGNRVFGEADVGVSAFVPSSADLAAMGTYDIVHTGECSQLEAALPAIAAAARRLSYDFSERPWEFVQQYARHVDIAIWSHPTADATEARRLAQEIQALGPSVVAVTMGAQGATVAAGDHAAHAAPPPDASIVDTLGAGDAFIARLLRGLALGEPLETTAAAATAYATATCAEFGAFGHATPDAASPVPIRLEAR